MVRSNGKSEIETPQDLDVEHELPPAEDENTAAAVQPEAQVGADDYQRLKTERDVLFDRLARLQAEFDNFRKRNAREQADFKDYAVADTARMLLPIVDSLERAAASNSSASDLRAGIELILRQFQDALAKVGVQPVNATQGQPFDPKLHEAVEMVETEEVPDHHLVDELQRGYRIKDRLLRPAMVRVARNPKH